MTTPPISGTLQARLHRTGAIAVRVIDDADDAVPLARALMAGDIDCIEVTLRTSVALDALKRIRAEVPEMQAGAGTVLTQEQAREVIAAGAPFGVALGMNPRVVAEARRVGLPFAPGVCTPTDIDLLSNKAADCSNSSRVNRPEDSPIAGSSAGSVSGLMNMGAQIRGPTTASLTPWNAEHFGWTASFLVAAGVCLAGSLAWLLVNPEAPISASIKNSA
jgi:hypothetical protein